MSEIEIRTTFLTPDLETATCRLFGMDGTELVASGAMDCVASGSYQYTRTITLPDGFVQGVLEFSDGTAQGAWTENFIYILSLMTAAERINAVGDGEGPVFIAPSPAPANQVYGYCYTVDAALTPVADVKIEWAMVAPSEGKETGYSIGRTQSSVSDDEGLFYQLFDIGSSYLIWRADNPSQKFPFDADDEDFELPSTLSKAVS